MHIQGNSTKHNITAINFTLGQNFPVTMLLLQALHLIESFEPKFILSRNFLCIFGSLYRKPNWKLSISFKVGYCGLLDLKDTSLNFKHMSICWHYSNKQAKIDGFLFVAGVAKERWHLENPSDLYIINDIIDFYAGCVVYMPYLLEDFFIECMSRFLNLFSSLWLGRLTLLGTFYFLNFRGAVCLVFRTLM